MFGTNPKHTLKSPLVKGVHAELETSDVKKYQPFY